MKVDSAIVVKNGKDVSRLDFLENLEWEGEVGDSADGIMSLGWWEATSSSNELQPRLQFSWMTGSKKVAMAAFFTQLVQLVEGDNSSLQTTTEELMGPSSTKQERPSSCRRSDGKGHKAALGGSLVGRSAVGRGEGLFVLAQGNNSIGDKVDWTFDDGLGRNWTDRH